MGIEIERKYLVHLEQWSKLSKPAGEFLRQGYLLTDPQKTIRVRVTESKAFLTIKGLSVGATRAEFEYEIPHAEGEELLNKFAITDLTKIRYKISFHGNIWEVDEFLADNAGLIVAEIELNSESAVFDIPGWITDEVTGDTKYYNSNLSLHPFKLW